MSNAFRFINDSCIEFQGSLFMQQLAEQMFELELFIDMKLR